MARRFSTEIGRGGTRFRIFPQPPILTAYRDPITIELSPPAGSVGVGPHDGRMCVIEPLGKVLPYGDLLASAGSGPAVSPPWRGPVAPPARPGPRGSFDHLTPDHPAFIQAHAYACVRLALDVWEQHLGRMIPWYFSPGAGWLEIGLLGGTYDNGEVGFGWLELGADFRSGRRPHPFAFNIDVIAHEVGHLVIYALVGEPQLRASDEYYGFHEACADMLSLLVSAHLPVVFVEVLNRTRGNLYGANELNRLGELSSSN